MRRHAENYLLDVITKRQKGWAAFFLRVLLWLLSWPYRLLTVCRNWAFDHGWLCRYYPPVPVVMSIGNIVVGGTGKTPITLMIAKEFYQDFHIAVLSRGYRSLAEKLPVPVILSKGEGPMQSAFFCGDEPFLLAQNLPKATVIVGKNRHKASDIAAKAGAELILLDDGMQHRRLARDYEVVVMDSGDPFGQGHYLPRGLLREGIHSLSRADLIILNHTANNQTFASIKAAVSRYSKAPVVGTKIVVKEVEKFDGTLVPSLKDMKAGIFCGIAHPEYFHQTVSEQGVHIVDHAFAADHKGFEKTALVQFAEQCKALGAEILLCTEKDKVKILDTEGIPLPIAWVKIGMQIVEGKDEWQAFIAKVKANIKQ